MTKGDEQSSSEQIELLQQVEQFIASGASRAAIAQSRTVVDSAIASMLKAERIDAETLKLTVTL